MNLSFMEFLARVVSHIPNKGQILQRYYGWYASRARGMRRKASEAGEKHPSGCVDPKPEALSEAGKRWAELLRPIFEVDPLACPGCGEEMRIVAFITEPQIIDRILDHLRRTAPTRPRPRAPPQPLQGRRHDRLNLGPRCHTRRSPLGDRWVARVSRSPFPVQRFT